MGDELDDEDDIGEPQQEDHVHGDNCDHSHDKKGKFSNKIF